MISRRSFLTQLGVLAAGGAAAWWLRDNVIWPQPKPRYAGNAASSGWLPFSSSGQTLVVVEATAQGRPVLALLDSGAQSSVIDRGLAAALGLSLSPLAPVLAFGVSGAPQIGRSAAVDLEVGDLVLAGLRAAVLELAPIAAAAGHGFGIILGQDVLRTVVADIDFPGRRVAFHSPAAYTPPQGAIAPPARTEGRELLVSIEVEGRPLEVVLDTGASGALALSPKAAETVGLLDGRPVRSAPSITFGGLSQDRVVRAQSLAFAGSDYGDVLVHIYEPPAGGRVPAGLLGVEVLDRYRVVLEQAQGRVHLIPGPPPPRRRRRRT